MTARELRMTGSLSAEGVVEWICHRARLLDLAGWVSRKDCGTLTIVIWGPEPMVDAMEVACSLGPVDVLVDRIESCPAPVHDAPNGFHVR